MGKPGVMFYFEVRPCLNRLSREEKGDLFEAILDYGQYGLLPELDGMAGVAWDFLQPKLDRDHDRYGVVTKKRAYAAYSRHAAVQGKEILPFEQWDKNLQTESANACTCTSEDANACQTTNYKPQTTNSKPQTPNLKLQTTNNKLQPGDLEPAATPALFSPPAREDILSYCQEKGYQMDVDSFLDYYTANGWKIGKSPMKNWQAAVRRWCRKENENGKTDDKTPWNIGTTL